jgi:hypothetical protein
MDKNKIFIHFGTVKYFRVQVNTPVKFFRVL